MKPLLLGQLFILAGLLCPHQGVLGQGLYYESTFDGGALAADMKSVSKTYLMPKMTKHVNTEDQDFLVIRLDTEKLISVNTREKTYWEQSFAELEKAMKASSVQMDKQMAEMQEYLKNLPEDQRKMVEGMTGGKPGEVRMNRTKETKSISGFSCTKYVAREGDRELMTIWATKDVRGFEPMRKDYEALSRRLTSMNPGFVKGLVDAMFAIDGFPIQTIWGGMTNTVTKVEQRSTPASAFDVPAGYQKIPAPADEMPRDEDSTEKETPEPGQE